MNEIRITSSPKYLWWHFVVLTLFGTFFLGFFAFQYVTGEPTNDHWYIELIFWLYVIYFGMSNLTKRGLSGVDEFVINNEEIRYIKETILCLKKKKN